MYYLVFSILAFFSIIELVSSTKNTYVFNFAYLLMTLMVMFRYGQFADYFMRFLRINPASSSHEWIVNFSFNDLPNGKMVV